MLELIPKLLGAIGLLSIIRGISVQNKLRQNWFFMFGGILLLIYSISLKDPIFIPLQIVFTLASLYEIYKLKKHG